MWTCMYERASQCENIILLAIILKSNSVFILLFSKQSLTKNGESRHMRHNAKEVKMCLVLIKVLFVSRLCEDTCVCVHLCALEFVCVFISANVSGRMCCAYRGTCYTKSMFNAITSSNNKCDFFSSTTLL